MKISWALCGLLVVVAVVTSSPIPETEVETDLSPLNEVYVVEADDAADDERGDRDKRKIGIVKLGVSNGIINFVFGKLDAFLDAKTQALTTLDESNKAKNAAFGIDNKQSATSQFISQLIQQKIQAGTGSIGPIINSAGTFLSTAANGLSGAFAAKLAPLSSLSGGVLSGGGNGGASSSGGSPSGILGGIISQKLSGLSSLSGSSNNNAGSSASSSSGSGASASANAGVNLGAFANLGGYDYEAPQATTGYTGW